MNFGEFRFFSSLLPTNLLYFILFHIHHIFTTSVTLPSPLISGHKTYRDDNTYLPHWKAIDHVGTGRTPVRSPCTTLISSKDAATTRIPNNWISGWTRSCTHENDNNGNCILGNIIIIICNNNTNCGVWQGWQRKWTITYVLKVLWGDCFKSDVKLIEKVSYYI